MVIRMPWKLRRAIDWVRANKKGCVESILSVFKKPEYKYKIIISSAFFGGVGGIEKLLMTLVESLPNAIFYIYARELRAKGFVPEGSNYRVNWPVKSGSEFDMYLYFPGGGRPEYLGDKYRFRHSIIDTCGANIKDIEDKFDWVAIQTGNANRYSNAPEKWLFAFPNIPLTFPKILQPVDLPEHYYLTVFNPYSDKLKGGDEVAMAADAACLPIVWCMSDKTGLKYNSDISHDNVIKLVNLTQEQLYYVYRNADAYISFSHSEGLGWSIAEAFYCNLQIITRDVGFVTYVKDQESVHLYDSIDELKALVSAKPYSLKSENDLRVLESGYFEKVIGNILAD